MIKQVILYNTDGTVARTEQIGAEGANVAVTVDSLNATDVQSAFEEVVAALSNIESGSGYTSGVIVDGVGELTTAMGNINAGIDIDGMAMDEVLAAAYGASDKVTLMHLSDTHGGTACLNACVSEANNDDDVDFILHTGDIITATYNAMLSAECDKPILGILGNHDAWDTYSQDNDTAVAAVRNLNGDNVVWASDDRSDWYKDVVTDAGKTIRFIGLNEYDYSNDAAVAWIYTVCYTQTQMEWFLNLLHDTPSDYYIVMVVHQPVQSAVQSAGDWVSTLVTRNFYSGPDASWLPKIIKAYTEHTAFTGTFEPTYREALNFSVSKDFSDLTESATFLCYLAGHNHYDWHAYLASYPDQLMFDVTRADTAANDTYSNDDVDRTDITYAANKVTFDLTLRKIIVERIGSTTLTGGGTRERIVFDF